MAAPRFCPQCGCADLIERVPEGDTHT
ncbi:NUDIX hydrolase, partial [Pseudomonas syringae pv. tagetis]